MAGLADSPQWQWNWTALCGPDQFQIWSTHTHDLGLCFEQLALEIPVLSLLGVISSFYFGKQDGFVSRGRLQLAAIKMRSIVVLCLALLPILQVYIDINTTRGHIKHISFFLSAVQGICWFTHFLYLIGLKSRLGLSSRGPMVLCILWSFLFVLSAISLRTHYLINKYAPTPEFAMTLSFGFSFCYFILQVFYALTLIPSQGTTTYLSFGERYSEVNINYNNTFTSEDQLQYNCSPKKHFR